MVCATHSTQEVFDKIMPCTYTNYFFLDTPMTKAFRNAQVHISTLGTININNDLTIDQKHEFVHEVLGPALYQFSSGSYYSESEYSMTKGQWQERFWEPETYQIIKGFCKSNKPGILSMFLTVDIALEMKKWS